MSEPRCVNAHDRCYEGGPCPYCESRPFRSPAYKVERVSGGFNVRAPEGYLVLTEGVSEAFAHKLAAIKTQGAKA